MTISEISPEYFYANTIVLKIHAMLIFWILSIYWLKGPDQHAKLKPNVANPSVIVVPLNGAVAHM